MSEIYCVVRGVLFELPEPIVTATTAPGLAIVAMLVRNGSLTYAADYVPEREDFVTAITVPDGTETAFKTSGIITTEKVIHAAIATSSLPGTSYRWLA